MSLNRSNNFNKDSLNDKFNMTLEQNVFYAKRNIIDTIWKSAHIEGINVTYTQTDVIYNGGIVSGLSVDEITAINNLKWAWRFLLDNLEAPTDFNFICKLNSLVGSNLIYGSGYPRKFDVAIGGTKWKPELPDSYSIKSKVDNYIKSLKGSLTENALDLCLFLMRSQIFPDGNKRTSMLIANKMLIENGKGILSIPVELKDKFGELLIHYYESNDSSEIKKFLYDNCIDGIIVKE